MILISLPPGADNPLVVKEQGSVYYLTFIDGNETRKKQIGVFNRIPIIKDIKRTKNYTLITLSITELPK